MPVVAPATAKQPSTDPHSPQLPAGEASDEEVPTKESSDEVSQASEEKVESIAYEPPFPDRENPFLAPQRNVQSAQGEGSNSRDEIQLLGFANVGRQKAILSINGMVVPIGEGDLESGIEVISIHPPAVVLQRNRQRWQTSLEY